MIQQKVNWNIILILFMRWRIWSVAMATKSSNLILRICTNTIATYVTSFINKILPRNSSRTPRNRFYLPRSQSNGILPFLVSSIPRGVRFSKELPSLVWEDKIIYFRDLLTFKRGRGVDYRSGLPICPVDELMNSWWVEIRTRYDRHQCRTHTWYLDNKITLLAQCDQLSIS